MSHDVAGKRKQGGGFWGIINKCQPVEGVSGLPKWLLRASSAKALKESTGTKLLVLGFDGPSNWQKHLAVSVAENFFAAISNGELRVEIDDTYTLDQQTISEFFERANIRKIIDNLPGEPEQFDNSKNYLRAFRGGTDIIIEDTERLHLGFCKLQILVSEGLPKKVCVLRNGMFITDSLPGLKSFSDFKDFVAVFYCQSQKGNELLRAMEPPRHDAFEPPLLATKSEQVKGAQALRDLAKWVRDELKRHAKDPVSEVTEIDDLKDFFSDEGASDTGKGAEEINPYGDVIIRARPFKLTTETNSEEGDGNEDGGGRGKGSGGGDGTGGRRRGADSPPAIVDINNVRAIITSATARKLALTPVKSGKISIHVKEAGADSDYDTAICKTNKGTISDDGVVIDVKAGKRVTLNVELKEEFTGALKVVAYEV